MIEENGQLQFTFIRQSLPLLTPEEIYALADQRLVQLLREDKRIERKPSGIQPKFLAEYFSMWANTPPDGGVIVVGIENDGRVINGCAGLPHNRLNEIESAGREFCHDAKYIHKRVPVKREDGDGDFLVVFLVFYNPKKAVTTHCGEAFKRFGESKHKLRTDEVHELEIEKGQVDFELEPIDLRYPDHFDVKLISEFTSSVKKSSGWGDHADVEVLKLRRLGTSTSKGFKPNVACALLFALDPLVVFPGCKVRFFRYEGEYEQTGTEFNAVKDITIEGPVPMLIPETERALEAQLRTFSRLGSDGKFYTAPEYPKEAWYEAIVNACVHRSYNMRNMNIFVKMFNDRLVVESPGGFPPFVTPDNIYESSHPRNPHLMSAMFHLHFVKAANEGTRRMREMMSKMNLPQPEFSEKDAGYNTQVRVTLRNSVKQRRLWVDSDVIAIVGEHLAKQLNEEERMAVNHAATHGRISVSEVQRLTGRAWHSAKRILEGMTEKGILFQKKRHFLDRDPQARYFLKPPELSETPIVNKKRRVGPNNVKPAESKKNNKL
jgi:ATP-dependent DNA helicase RecG